MIIMIIVILMYLLGLKVRIKTGTLLIQLKWEWVVSRNMIRVLLFLYLISVINCIFFTEQTERVFEPFFLYILILEKIAQHKPPPSRNKTFIAFLKLPLNLIPRSHTSLLRGYFLFFILSISLNLFAPRQSCFSLLSCRRLSFYGGTFFRGYGFFWRGGFFWTGWAGGGCAGWSLLRGGRGWEDHLGAFGDIEALFLEGCHGDLLLGGGEGLGLVESGGFLGGGLGGGATARDGTTRCYATPEDN